MASSAHIYNAKGFLIILVVWGHLIEPAVFTIAWGKALFAAIYLFHIPAFALLSGMLSKSHLEKGDLLQLVRKLVLPLIVLQLFYWPVLKMLEPLKLGGILTPSWVLWFLLSLIFWKLMLPVFARLKFAVLISLGLALGAGYIDQIGPTLSLSRTLIFFPAFLVGHRYGHVFLKRAGEQRLLFGTGFLVLTAFAATLGYQGASIFPLYGNVSFSVLSDPITAAHALDRLLIIVAGIAASVTMFALVPATTSTFTIIGQRTFTVFLLHALLAVALWRLLPAELVNHQFLFLGMTGVLAIMISLLLARFHPAFVRSLDILYFALMAAVRPGKATEFTGVLSNREEQVVVQTQRH